MKNAEKRQSEINEETYKTNVMNQRRTENQRRSQNPMTLLTEINYTRTELIEYANEHNIYKKGTKQKKLITQNLKPNAKLEARTNVTNSGAYTDLTFYSYVQKKF